MDALLHCALLSQLTTVRDFSLAFCLSLRGCRCHIASVLTSFGTVVAAEAYTLPATNKGSSYLDSECLHYDGVSLQLLSAMLLLLLPLLCLVCKCL